MLCNVELSSRDKWTSSAFFVSYFERSVEKNINSDFVMENRLTMCLECWDPVFIYIVNYQRPILLGYLNLAFSYIMKKGCALNKEENPFMWGPLWPVLVGVKWHNRRRGIVPFCFVFLCISCFCFISRVWILASFFPPHGKRARFAIVFRVFHEVIAPDTKYFFSVPAPPVFQVIQTGTKMWRLRSACHRLTGQ